MTELEKFLHFLQSDNHPDRKTEKFRAKLHDTLVDFLAEKRDFHGRVCKGEYHVTNGSYCPDCQP